MEELWVEVGKYKQFLTKLIFMLFIIHYLIEPHRKIKHNYMDMDKNLDTISVFKNFYYLWRKIYKKYVWINRKPLQQQHIYPILCKVSVGTGAGLKKVVN